MSDVESFVAFPPPFDFALLRGCADDLRAAADTVGSTADFLTGRARVPPAVFEGDAGRTYRTATDALTADVELLGGDLRALGAALEQLTDRAQQVRDVMLAIHAVADAQGFPRAGHRRSLPPASSGDQIVVFDTLCNRAEEANRVLEWAKERWATALELHAGVRPVGAPSLNYAPPAPDWPPADWPTPSPPLLPDPGAAPTAPVAPRDPILIDQSAPVDRPPPDSVPDGAAEPDRDPGRDSGPDPDRLTGATAPAATAPPEPDQPARFPPRPAPLPGVLGRPEPIVPDPAETYAHDLTELLR